MTRLPSGPIRRPAWPFLTPKNIKAELLGLRLQERKLRAALRDMEEKVARAQDRFNNLADEIKEGEKELLVRGLVVK